MRFGQPTAIVEPLEDGQRLLVVPARVAHPFEVQVPVAEPIQTMRKASRLAHFACQLQSLAMIVAGAS